MKGRSFTCEEVVSATAQSTSFLGIARLLGTKRETARYYVHKYGLDIRHFKGGRGRFTAPERLFVVGTRVRNKTIKQAILRLGLLPDQCSICSLGPEWRGGLLVLELDHINGNNKDNRLENVRFLCPNCHSQTNTYCGRNQKHT